ncbi:MAG: HAD family hydrolase [Chloroflexi bacterium]|nr:HAD family hydrolase [Chloroflexota bacterium]
MSGECGAGKPDPRIFQRALHHFRVPPPAAVMVSDSLERDIAGAYAAGCRPIWINRLGAVPPASSAPTPAITTLSELPLLLAQAGPSRSEKSITRSR